MGNTNQDLPSKKEYRNKYCKQLIEHMEKGHTFESFAATLEVPESTLENWKIDYEEFFDACQVGETKARDFWEKLGMAGAAGKIKNFSYITWYTTMKNRFGYH